MKMTPLALALVAAAACGRAPSPPPEAREPRLAVVTVPVTVATAETATVPATVLARERATLVARVPGTVIALPYREGQAVRAGEVVARIEDRALRSGVEAAEAGKAAADAALDRLLRLLASGAVTAQEADEARARAAAAQAAVASARDTLGYAELRAPFGGRVSARPARVGDVAMPGTPLLEMEGATGLEVVATVEAAHASRVRPGSRLGVEVDGQPASLTAVVRAVSEGGDPLTHRLQVRADLPGAEGLRSGLFARLRLDGDAAGAAPDSRLTVPGSALVRRGGLTGVYVVRDGRARLRWIAAGEAADGTVEVRAGLDRGERVVLDAAGLSDGIAVQEG